MHTAKKKLQPNVKMGLAITFKLKKGSDVSSLPFSSEMNPVNFLPAAG